MHGPRLCWVDGALHPIDEPVLRATDSAFSLGLGCYSTARVANGRPRFADRHAARLVRDARRLGLGDVDPARVVQALEETGEACFADGTDGVVRVQASRDAAERLRLTAVPRATGPEPVTWTARVSAATHEGPMPWSGAKVSNHLLFSLARDEARRSGADEALLLDREGYLVEGSRSNIVVVSPAGVPSTPDLARGGVAGVGLEVLNERGAGIRVRHVSGRELSGASELIAVNAVRGPKSIVALDGQPVGNGRPGPVAERLAACFDPETSPTRG